MAVQTFQTTYVHTGGCKIFVHEYFRNSDGNTSLKWYKQVLEGEEQ